MQRLVYMFAVCGVVGILSQSVDVFEAGKEGYACYRIPSVIMTSDNTLVAFAEGRKYSCGDHGYIDIVYKRSRDFGNTWSDVLILYSNSTSQLNFNTIGNPSPVQDKNTSKIWILFCKNNKQIYSTYSIDDGTTFALPPTELSQVNNPQWNWVATGPPNGLQLSNGRMIVPIDWSIPSMFSTKGYVVYSDDGGNNWRLSKPFGTDAYWPNESQAVQLKNGSIFINSRTGKNDSFYRLGSLSNDGGDTFVETNYIEALRDVNGGCQGSMFKAETNGNIYYSGLTPSAQTVIRANLTLHVSKDEGNSWEYFAVVEAGSSAYSSVVEIKSQSKIAVLYERGNYGYISFNSWLISN